MADLKIFRLDECSWYVAHDLMEFLNWYHKNIEPLEDPERLKILEMFNPEDGLVWSAQSITPEDILAIEGCVEVDNGGVGDLKRRGGEIFKRQTFADILGDMDIEEPHEIASTEF